MSKQVGSTAILVVVFLCVVFSSIAFSQDSLLVSYQGLLTDDQGQPITGTSSMVFTIYDEEGESKWSETQPLVQATDGYFTVILGTQIALPDTVFKGEDRYLGIAIEGEPEISPRTLFTAAPLAAHALSSEGTGWVVDGSTMEAEEGINRVVVGQNLPINAWGKIVAGGSYAYGALGITDYGVKGVHESTGNYGVLGGGDYGVAGYVAEEGFYAVYGEATEYSCKGVLGYDGSRAAGVYGARGTGESWGGYFYGDVGMHGGNLSINFIYDEKATEDLVIGKNIGSYNGHRLVIGDDIDGASTGLVIGEDSDTRCWMLWDVDDNYFSIGNIVQGYNWGNVLTVRGPFLGVGTLNPTVDLYVAGDICYTGTIGSCSDIRYKQNISTLNNALDKVSRMRGVGFKWRRDEYPEQKFTDQPQVGFVAQELKEILPEAVTEDANGYYNVDYGKVTPLLVEAIKEQQEQIETLSKRIEELEGMKISSR